MLLRQLYSELHIPEAVWRELAAGPEGWPGRDEVLAATWIHRHGVRDRSRVEILRRELDEGEAEGICLALELGADLILVDEKEGREAARRVGLRVVGVLGILLEAKARGLVGSVRPCLDALREAAGFYLSDSLHESVLAAAGEAS